MPFGTPTIQKLKQNSFPPLSQQEMGSSSLIPPHSRPHTGQTWNHLVALPELLSQMRTMLATLQPSPTLTPLRFLRRRNYVENSVATTCMTVLLSARCESFESKAPGMANLPFIIRVTAAH